MGRVAYVSLLFWLGGLRRARRAGIRSSLVASQGISTAATPKRDGWQGAAPRQARDRTKRLQFKAREADTGSDAFDPRFLFIPG
jgi:hypothetical protein